MIKIDGVDIPRIEYIDPVDGKVSILRVMQDGVQIWPDDSGVPNTPTGIQLSEYEIVDELQIPTGITLTEVIQTTIEWDYFITYTVTTNTEVRAYLKDDVILPFTGGDETQFELKVNGSPVVFTNFGIHYAPGASYVTLRNPTDFLPTDVIEFSYTAGADPIEGESTGTFAPDLVDQLVENTVEAPTYTYLLDDYPGAAAAYSLRKLRTGIVQGIMVRRDSDDQLVDVQLYDDPSKSIDLDSIIAGGGAGTLGEWVGSASAFIFNWYDQSGNNNHASQSTEANQPRVVNAGVLEVENGKATVYNNENNTFLYCPVTILNTGDTFIPTIITVSKSNSQTTSTDGRNSTSTALISGVTASDRRKIGISTEDNSECAVRLDGGNTVFSSCVTSSQFLSFVTRPLPNTNFSMSFNGSSKSVASSGGTKTLNIQSDSGITLFKYIALSTYSSTSSLYGYLGNIQEVIWYFNDQTSNKDAIETNINSAYNIWVVTAEVDAQLIQADADNVSDTVIEINGVRSSASDTAVANLIARNNTVITN